MKSSGETRDRASAEAALVAAAVPRELAHARAACAFDVFPPPTACDALFRHPAPNLRRNRILAAEPRDSADVSAQLCDLRFPANAMRRYAFQERFDRAITDEMHPSPAQSRPRKSSRSSSHSEKTPSGTFFCVAFNPRIPSDRAHSNAPER